MNNTNYPCVRAEQENPIKPVNIALTLDLVSLPKYPCSDIMYHVKDVGSNTIDDVFC